MTKTTRLLKASALALMGWAATLVAPTQAQAQEQYFIAQTTFWAGNFAPRSWAECDGQLLAISSNNALFSLVGTIYGGDGRTTFGLPDMRGRASIHPGSGPGLTPRRLGERLGTEQVTYTVVNLASHGHTGQIVGTSGAANSPDVAGNALAMAGKYAGRATLDATMLQGSAETTNTGGNQSVDNIQPSLAVNCIIQLFGIYPSRS